MSSTWGKNLILQIFGESHGAQLGFVLDGIPSGIQLDLDQISFFLKRRSASSYDLATPRKETDEFEIVSGFFNGYTTGTPLCFLFKNQNTKSRDYTPEIPRPSHADYTANLRYSSYQDYRGGGHFSGRLTAPIVAAGAICKQILRKSIPSIEVFSHIYSVQEIVDRSFLETEEFNLDPFFPLIHSELKERIIEKIKKAREELDSVGGVIETMITGFPAGYGNPFFGSVESLLSSLLFSIPAVKGVEFGTGFDITKMKGSQANDPLYFDERLSVKTKTNHNGGINGGITNGMPIIFKTAFKPTPSIAKEQNTINLKTKQNIKYQIHGRHDPCITLRAHVITEAVSYLALTELLFSQR